MNTMPATRLVRRLALGAVLFAILALAGCGRPVGTVTGKVTFGPKVVKGGNVTFVSTEGQPSMSTTISEDGTYKIANATGGNYKVCVETMSVKGPPPSIPSANTPKAQALDPGTKVPEGYTPSSPADASLVAARARGAKLYVHIPDSYSDSSKTDLSYTVVGGDQTYNIELK